MKILPAVFEQHEIRRAYNESTEIWYFSVVDIVQVLTEQPAFQSARKFWNNLKERLKKEGSEVTNCHRLIDYWAGHEVNKGEEFAILTNIVHQEWSGVTVQDHKATKGLKSQNLRDHISQAEISTRQIAEKDNATGLTENKVATKTGGGIARNARLELEQKTGKKVVTGQNFLTLAQDWEDQRIGQ